MKKNSDTDTLTKSEVEILKLLWLLGPATVRMVNDEINKNRDVKYTSTLKLMQIMLEKGILKRDDSKMKHVYSPVEEEQKTKKSLLNNFINNFYGGSASTLFVQLTGKGISSKKELEEIKEIMKNMEDEI
ncbi:BlaI/MecI/CopY family transcriptional regulator [Algoriphagus sp. D3-2-R+10]|uniref:BlaI/MecI/CopY family transcriptional regulator n=1 Tax=Algoriphagus aurantiacus TaxID=3103948 RepID=UPI002B3657D3|nr:BlaI/MecI/CopY family transcriptional regulator [Algoriphagus sp. D3-2-R+10]MEB2774593.1 BlaI/MecI/CopY family transcriptional regulator [Algoriphagus sp. D3-2-R+10]